MKKLIHHGSLIGALLVGTALSLGAQLPDNPGGTNQWTDHQRRHEQRQARHEQIAAEIKAQDAELEQLLTQMTNAAPAQKLDAVAAVVSKLVEDRLALHQTMESMHGTNAMQGTNAPSDQGTGTLPPTP